jgi:hypothetical protein
LGYLYKNELPKSEVDRRFELPLGFDRWGESATVEAKIYDAVIIGDSYSEQDTLGYKNFLANKGVNVLHVGNPGSRANPLQTLISLINSDFFDHVHTSHIVLQCAQRVVNERSAAVDFNAKVDLDSLALVLQKSHGHKQHPEVLPFFSEATLKIPLTNAQYRWNDHPEFSQIYRFQTKQKGLFSGNGEDVLVFEQDVRKLVSKNDPVAVKKTVAVFEELNTSVQARGMELVVLVSPDKYDVYYPFLDPRAQVDAPQFFEYYLAIPKVYKDVPAFDVLTRAVMEQPDVYYYDDSHWSPVGAELVADQIERIIRE